MNPAQVVLAVSAVLLTWAAAAPSEAGPAPRPVPSNKYTQALCASVQNAAEKNACLRNQINAYNACNRQKAQQKPGCFLNFCNRVPDAALKKECQRTLARYDEDKEKDIQQKIAAIRQEAAKLEGELGRLRNQGRALCRQQWNQNARRPCEVSFGAKLPPQRLR